MNRRGSISPLCIGLVLVGAFTGFGTWGILRAWRFRVETQLQLDQCVAREALSLKTTAQIAEASNLRMTAERTTAAAADLTPPSAAAVQAVLVAEEMAQEAIRLKWQGEKLLWISGALCHGGKWLGQYRQFDVPDWKRLPPDSLGPQPYQWTDEKPKFRIEIRSGSRSAAATVNPGDENEENPINGTNWQAQWTVPREGLGPNLH